jgi:hypothetical protein
LGIIMTLQKRNSFLVKHVARALKFLIKGDELILAIPCEGIDGKT